MQQKTHPFSTDGASGQSALSVGPQTEKTGNNYLPDMWGSHGNHPDEDIETTDQEGHLPHISEKGGIVM